MITLNEPIVFGTNNLLDVEGLTITGYDTFRDANRDIRKYHRANTNRSLTTSSFKVSKPLPVRGIIARNSRDLLDQSVQDLKGMLRGMNKTLRLPVGDGVREYKDVTVNNVMWSDISGGYISFDIEFVCDDPFAYQTTLTTALNEANETSGIQSYPITFNGNVEQMPIITYTIDSLTNGTNKTVSFINPSGSQLSIQRTWTASEVLVINCYDRTLQIDGEDVVFAGNFLEFEPGAGFLNYEDTFTARQVDIQVTYYRRDE